MFSSKLNLPRSTSAYSDEDLDEEDPETYDDGEMVEDIQGRIFIYHAGQWVQERNNSDDYPDYLSTDESEPESIHSEEEFGDEIPSVSEYLRYHYLLSTHVTEMLSDAEYDNVNILNWYDFVSMYLDCILMMKYSNSSCNSTVVSSIDSVIALCEEFLDLPKTIEETKPFVTVKWYTTDGTGAWDLRDVFDDLKAQYP